MEQSKIPIFCSKDAFCLISRRSLLPHRVFLSVKGCITSMSEKMRVKNEDFFLIELDHCVFIIVKDYHLYWHDQLVPLDTVVFYELRLTTIEKGVFTPQPILAACISSRIAKVPQDKTIACCTLEEWLSMMGLKKQFDLISSSDSHRKNNESVLTYNGKVTDVSKAYDGIYELSDNIRLLTWSNPSILRDPCLHNDGHIRVYNAHEIEFGHVAGQEYCASLEATEESTGGWWALLNPDAVEGKTLVCCPCTLIRSEVDHVERLNVMAKRQSFGKQSSLCTLEDLKMTISKYRLNFREVERLLSFKDSLKATKRKELIYLLHTIAKSFCPVKSQDVKITILDMFLQHAEFCPFVYPRSSDCRIKNQITVSQLKEDSNVASGNEFEDRGDTNCWGYWSRERKNGEILLGHISIKEGQTEFIDQSGKIPIVLVHQWDELVSHGQSSRHDSSTDLSKKHGKRHICSCACQKDYTAAENISCPYITDQIIGKMLYVTNFHLVTECYTTKEGCDLLRYLIFSLQDCVILEKTALNSSTEVFCDIGVRKQNVGGYSNISNYIVGSDSNLGCYIYVSEKKQLLYSEKLGHSFLLHGRMLDPSYFTIDKCLEALILKEKESNSAINECSLNDKIKANCDNSTDEMTTSKRKLKDTPVVSAETCHPKKMKNSDSDQTLQTSQTPFSNSLPFSMRFNHRNAYYFPLIHSGHCYQLTSAKAEGKVSNGFQPMFSNEKLGKAVNKCGAKILIEAPKDINVIEVSHSSMVETMKTQISMEEKLAPVSIAQVSSEDFQDSLVSFTAVIIRREIQHSYFASSKDQRIPSSSSLSLRDVRVDLCDFESYLCSNGNMFMNTISLFFGSPQMNYVLGLIPGLVVDICCVERKVSKNSTVYCRFISVSSLHVKYFVPQKRLENALSNPMDFTQFTREYIGTIWNHGPGDHPNAKSATWLIQCHICVVFSLRLELSCKKCNRLFVNSRCQSRACDNTSFDVNVASVILVEDGTCQAIVKLWKPHLVRKLLTLNDEQWGDVISLLQSTGHIYISKTADESLTANPIEIFLTGLIASPLVIRPAAMLVRVFKNSPCRKAVDKMNEKEFKMKDFRHGKFSFKTLNLPFLNLDCVDFKEGQCHY